MVADVHSQSKWKIPPSAGKASVPKSSALNGADVAGSSKDVVSTTVLVAGGPCRPMLVYVLRVSPAGCAIAAENTIPITSVILIRQEDAGVGSGLR